MPEREMSSMERVLAVCRGEMPDRVPFVLTSREFGIKCHGMKFSQAYRDPDAYVASQVGLLERFGLDGVYDIWCTPAVDEAMGAHMLIPEDDSPSVPDPFLERPEDLNKLQPVDPQKDGRLPYLLEVVRKLKRAVGTDVPVIAWASPPFRTACMLRGMVNFYQDFHRRPEFAKELLEVSYAACVAYGKALVDAGADIICTSNPVANMDCISRKAYAEFSHPYSKRMWGELKEHGAKAVLFHTCGRWLDRYDLVCDENIDVVHCDKIELAEFKAKYTERVAVMGNVRSVMTLLHGAEEDVRRETLECLRQGAPFGRYIASADCAVPRDTPPANVQAMAGVVKQYGKYPLQW